MSSYFAFNQTRSSEMGLVIEHYPRQTKPARKIQFVRRIGDNGSLLLQDGGYESTTMVYDCYFKGSPKQASEIANWLLSSPGYGRLEDTYNRVGWRKAICLGPLDIENIFNRHGRCSIAFTCQPEIYIPAGDVWNLMPENKTLLLENPTQQIAKPLLKITGTGPMRIIFENIKAGFYLTMDVAFDPVNSITLDCETGVCLDNDGAEVSRIITIKGSSMPMLYPGQNKIQVMSGGKYFKELKVKPRWWVL